MILKVVDFILGKQLENGMISKDDTSVYQYGYTLVLEVMVNIIIAATIGLISGELLNVALFLVIFMPLRSYCGGYHASNTWICIILSNIIIAGVVLAINSLQFVIDYIPFLVTEAICAITILLLAPIQSDAKKLDNDEKQVYRKKVRFILITEILCVLLLFFFLKLDRYGFLIIMAHIVQAASLLAVHLNKTMKYLIFLRQKKSVHSKLS